jgi:DNA-binding transcriptional MocR family regulator
MLRSSGIHRHRFSITELLGRFPNSGHYVTQQQIAQHLGLTREVIARLMQDFVARGLVKSKQGLSMTGLVSVERSLRTGMKARDVRLSHVSECVMRVDDQFHYFAYTAHNSSRLASNSAICALMLPSFWNPQSI